MSRGNKVVIGGRVVPPQVVAEYRDSSAVADTAELQRRMNDDGYLFLRDVLNRSDVLAAREEVFSRLAAVGEIKSPAIDGIMTDESQRRELVDDLVAFWRSVSEGPALRQVSHGPQVRAVMEAFFGEPSRPQNYLWLRPRAPGWATALHYDHPFFARGSCNVHTVWIALGDIPLCDGPLMLVEGSHRFDDLLEPLHAKNQLVNTCPDTAIREAFLNESITDPVTFVRERNTRLLSADFRVGDLLIFGMNMLHGSPDNHSAIGRVRLSCDVRYQPAADPLDDRYFGPDPTGQSGSGYGDMNSCKPLTET